MVRGCKLDELVRLRNPIQTLLSKSPAVFISVIVYPPTLQFVTVSFSSKMQERHVVSFFFFLHFLG